MTRLKSPVLMAVIGAPHGVKGELRVRSYTADPLALGDYGPLATADGRTYTVGTLRAAKTVLVVRFREVPDRSTAEALNGTELFVERSALPGDLDEEEFYVADLVGLKVVDPAGAVLGKVLAVHDFGAGDIVEVGLSGRRPAMVPFTKAAVPAVDIEAGRIVVDPAAAGLVEDGLVDDEEKPG